MMSGPWSHASPTVVRAELFTKTTTIRPMPRLTPCRASSIISASADEMAIIRCALPTVALPQLSFSPHLICGPPHRVSVPTPGQFPDHGLLQQAALQPPHLRQLYLSAIFW